MLLSLRLGWALLGRGPSWKAFVANIFPAPYRSEGVTVPPSWGWRLPLLEAERAAQGTCFGSLVSLLSRESSGSDLQRPGPQSQLGPSEWTATLAQGVSAVPGGQGSGGSWK